MPSTDAPAWWADVQQDRDDLQGRGRRPAESWLDEEIDFVPRRRITRDETAGDGADHPLHGVFVPAADTARPTRTEGGAIVMELELTRAPDAAELDDDVEHELRHLHVADDPFLTPPPPVGARRTVQITGHPGLAAAAAISNARRHRPRSASARIGARPDRVALWAVLLGAILIILAATSSSSDAATPRVHAPAARTAHVAVHHAPAAAPLRVAR